jgi:hypothetical protein
VTAGGSTGHAYRPRRPFPPMLPQFGRGGKPAYPVCVFSGSVLGARCLALGVDSVPGPGYQVPGTRDLRPGNRTESRYRKGRPESRRDSRFMLRKTRPRGQRGVGKEGPIPSKGYGKHRGTSL